MNLIERPCNQREYYDYENNTGAALAQFHFILKVNAGAIPAPVLGNIPDHNGIANGAYGKIESQIGSVWQLSQIDVDVTLLPRDTALYMAPGAGNFHATPVEGDYRVAFLTVAMAAGDDYVTAQLVPPERVPDDEIAT